MDDEKILHVKCHLTQFNIGNKNEYNLTIKDQFGDTILNTVWVKESQKNWRGKIDMGTSLDEIFKNEKIRKYYWDGNQETIH